MELSASQVRSLMLDEHAILRDVLEEIEAALGELTRRVPGGLVRLRATLRTFRDAFLRHRDGRRKARRDPAGLPAAKREYGADRS